MKDAAVSTLLLTALAALAASTAEAQNANARVQQRATQPARQVQPAPAVTATPAVRATTAIQVTPSAVAGKQILPANIFSIEDRAIIIVGGKQTTAGEVKRQLASDLRQAAGPAVLVRSRPRSQVPAGAPVRDDPLGPMVKGPRNSRRPSITDRITATSSAASAASVGAGRQEAITASPALSYTEMKNYCKTHPIEISRVRGTVTPNGRFTIEGICFGDQTGIVEVIGQFPGGNMRLVFESWSDVEIRAFVPPVSGAADHVIALTVIRLPDKVRSAAVQKNFIAARETVPVPASYWTPSADFLQIAVDQGGGNIFGGFTVFGSGPAEARQAPFSLHVNPACALDTAGASARTGQVVGFTGWENGPPYQANVNVGWIPRCVIQTTNYVVGTSSQRICSVDFSLSAQASCPVGVAP